jgi:hypothetical protein
VDPAFCGGDNRYGGRGLMLVHYAADLVRLHTGEDGTTVRFYLSL